MSKAAKPSPNDAPEQLSFLAKAVRGVKNFVKGTLYAIPMTAISSGAALGLSVLLKSTVGVDPLNVGDQFLLRWLGTTAIFGVVGGGMKTYEGWNREIEGNKESDAPGQSHKKEHIVARNNQVEYPTNAPYTPNRGQELRATTIG